MEADTNKRTDYERGYRDGYRDGIADKTWPKVTSSLTCSKCGLKAEGVMGYVCGHSNCPLFPRASWADPEWQRAHDMSKY